MKTLILSCSTGQGHNTAGRALLEALKNRGIPAEMHDALSFGKRNASKYVCGSYIKVTQVSPGLFGRLYQAGSAISNPFTKSPIYFANTLYSEKLKRFILDNGFDTVVCPHLFPAEAVTHLRKHREINVKHYGVATDYTCSPFWEETDIDAFFIPHEKLRAEYVSKGFTTERLVATGIPVSRAFRERVDQREARARLDLPQDKTLYLLMSGSMGFGDVPEIAQKLLAISGDSVQVLVLTGHNDRLTQKLEECFAGEPRLRSVAYTKQVALYMDACDVTLTKPGGLSSTEAAVKNIPFVHTAGIPGCETRNMAFFNELGIALPTTSPWESALAAALLHADGELRQRMTQSQREQINAKAAEDIVDNMLARENAPA